MLAMQDYQLLRRWVPARALAYTQTGVSCATNRRMLTQGVWCRSDCLLLAVRLEILLRTGLSETGLA